MNEKEIKEILEKFFNHTLGVTYKDPLMVYDVESLLSVVGKTVGVPDNQLRVLKLLIDKAKKTGRINDKLVKGLYKSIVETTGDVQLSSLILDKSKPTAERLSKIIELVYAPSYKGIYRNMSTTGPETNYDLAQTFQDTDVLGRTRRMPDGPTGFVPAYTNLLAAITAIEKGFIAFTPYRKVTNKIGDKQVINTSQSDMFVNSVEQIATLHDMKSMNPSGEVDVFEMTLDKYNDITRILEVVLADAELIAKYARENLLDPEVLKKLNNELQEELNKKKAEAKNKPVLDVKGQGMINALKEWKATQPDSWFGNNPVIINSGQMGIEEAALDIHNRNKMQTGGHAPAGFIANPVSNPKIFPQKGKEYNLTPLYKTEGVTPGVDIDDAKVYKYLFDNASPELKNHINMLARMGYDDVLLKLAQTYIYAKPLPKNADGTQDYQRGWSVKKGKQAEFSLAKQMNVDAADLNVIMVNSNKFDETALKTAMYSLYGEYKLPRNVIGYRAGGEYVVKTFDALLYRDIDAIADELRRKSQLKRPLEYWQAAAESKLKEIERTISKNDLVLNKWNIQGTDGVKKNTYVIDLSNFDHTTFANAMEDFQQELLGKGKVMVKIDGVLKIVDVNTNATQLFENKISDYTIHVTGNTDVVGGYYKDLAQRIVQALVSPDMYYEKLGKPQIMKDNMKGGTVQADYTKSPVAINDYSVINNEKMENVMTVQLEGGKLAPNYNNPNVVTQIDLIEQGKQNAFLIREADLLKKLGVANVKDAIKILKTNPKLRLNNFDAGQELKVNIKGWEKLEGYKFGETERLKDGNYKLTKPNQDYIDRFIELIGNPTATFKIPSKFNPETNMWDKLPDELKIYQQEGLIEYIINQSKVRYDKFKNKKEPHPFWLLEVGEVKSPSAKKAEAINEALRAIEQAQLQNARYWSYGQDPKAITRIGKNNYEGRVQNLFLSANKFEPLIADLYNFITSFEFGPRDFDMNRLMNNLHSDVFKSESLQEIVNALLTDDIGLTNAVKPVDIKQLEIARQQNFLGKLTMFYKLMGRHNAVLDAITLNIAKEMASRDYDLQNNMEKVQNFLDAVKNLDDLGNAKALEQIVNQTLGNHQDYLSSKIMETINALHMAEIEMLTKYPQLKDDYKNLRAIDKVEGEFMPPVPEDIDPETIEGAIMDRGDADPRFKNKKPTDKSNLMNALLESFQGLTGADLADMLESYQAYQEVIKTYGNEKLEYEGNRSKYTWIREVARIVNRIEGIISSANGQGRALSLTEEDAIANNIEKLRQQKTVGEFNIFKKSLEDVFSQLEAKPSIEFFNNSFDAAINMGDIYKRLGFFPGNVVDPFAALQRIIYDWSNFYLGESKLRVDNLFGSEVSVNYMGNEIEPFDDELYKSKLITEALDSEFLPHIFKDGLENFFASSPTALQALMMNDTNVNPAIQDKFIKDFTAEYGDIVINNEAMTNSMQSILPMIAQTVFVDKGSLSLLVDEMYKLTNKGEAPKVDFNDAKSLREYITEVADTLLSGDISSLDPRDMVNALKKVFPPDDYPELYRYITNDPLALNYATFVLETNLKRLALRPDNLKKILDAELSAKGIDKINFAEFKKKVLGNNVFKLLSGDGDAFTVQPEDVTELKKTTKARLQNMVYTYNRMTRDSNIGFKLVSNIPDKWEIKASQGKNFNPFVVAPSKGSDAFYHIEMFLKDPSIGLMESLSNSKEAQMALQHILEVEQPSSYVNNTSINGNQNSSVLKSGFLNSYLYSDSLSEYVGMEALQKQMREEIKEIKAFYETLKEETLSKVTDETKIKQLELTFEYLEDGLNETFKMAEARALSYSREFVAEKGTKSFYGLDDAGAFPIAKLKIDKALLQTAPDVRAFTQFMVPILLRNKSLDISDMKSIQDKLLQDGVNFEIAQYVEVLQDLTEKKFGRKNIDNALELANNLHDTMFFDSETGLMKPIIPDTKEFKISGREAEFHFIQMLHKFNQGVDVSKLPQIEGTPDNKQLQEYFQGTYNIYESTYENIKSNRFTEDGRNIGQWWEDTKNKYKIMTDRLVEPPKGPIDRTNFKDFGSMFMMQFSKDALNEVIKPWSAEDDLIRTYTIEMENISSHIRNRQDTLFEYINTIIDIPTTPMLLAGNTRNKTLAERGPLGWQIVEPARPAIPLGPPQGPSDLILRGQSSLLYDDSVIALQRGPNFGEGDPFNNAFTAPTAKKVKAPRDFTVLKNIVDATRNIRYSKAKYQYNFGRGKALTMYTGAGPQTSMVAYENVNPFKRYFRNLRTLTELPYFYNKHAGKSGPRVYVGYYVTEPYFTGQTRGAIKRTPRQIYRKTGILGLPTKPGVDLNASVFEDWYRTTKSAYLTNTLVTKPARAYGRVNQAAFYADMILAFNAYNKDTAGMSYEEFINHANTKPAQQALNKVFYPIQKIMEIPFNKKEKLLGKKTKLKEQLDMGEITKEQYDNTIKVYNMQEKGINTDIGFVTFVGRLFEGFMEGGPRNIGRQLEQGRQRSELIAENYKADTEEEWLANIQKSYSDLAKTKHLSYNYSDDYYSSARRFINRQMRNMKMFNKDKTERVGDPEYMFEKPQDIYNIPGGLK